MHLRVLIKLFELVGAMGKGLTGSKRDRTIDIPSRVYFNLISLKIPKTLQVSSAFVFAAGLMLIKTK